MGLLSRRSTAVTSTSAGVTTPADRLIETAVPMRDAPARRPTVVAGEVTKMRMRPTSGLPALAVTVTDGTGSVVVVWTGRRSIGGVTLGRSLAVEGVAVRRDRTLEFTNPAYTLLTREQGLAAARHASHAGGTP